MSPKANSMTWRPRSPSESTTASPAEPSTWASFSRPRAYRSSGEVAACKLVLQLYVVGDLVGDGGVIALQFGDPLEPLVPVSFEQRASHREGAVAPAAKLGVALHVSNRHPRGAQALQEGQPREILGVVTTLA